MKLHRLTTLACLVFVVSSLSCTTAMKPADFSNKSPRFVPEEYFLGKTQGTGIIFDRGRNVKVAFTVDLDGVAHGDTFQLNEKLRLDTGESFDRTYTLKKVNEHLYDLTCPDINGPATVESYGNAIKLTYSLTQTMEGKSVTLSFDDWMFLQPNGIVLNRAFATKYGFDAAEVFMSIRKN